MAFTSPTARSTGYVVIATTWNNEVATNGRIFYLHDQYNRIGSGSSTSVGAYGSVQSFAEHVTPVVFKTDDLDDEGTVQMRIITGYNITAVGACTSLTLTNYLTVLMASGSTGTIGTSVSAKANTALTTAGGTLTTGWKFADSGWTALSAMVTDLSAYLWTVANPAFRFDTAGGSPTIGRIASTVAVRVA